MNGIAKGLTYRARGMAGFGLALAMTTAAFQTAQAQDPVTPPGEGTASSPYKISELGHLVWIGQNTMTFLNDDYYFSLQNDIDAADTTNWYGGAGFIPIGSGYATRFVGVFNGNGKVIRNLYINRPGSGIVGLFGWIDNGGQILNLGLEGGSVVGGEITGSLAAYLSYSSMSNCYASVSVSGYRVGGLVGVSVGGTLIHCHASGAVTGGDEAGGLVGENNVSPVRGCYATGPVSGGEYVGGLFSYNNGPVSDCFATGPVNGSITVGGLVGMNSDAGTLERCYSAGAVAGSTYVGGFAGYNSCTISNSYWDTNTSGRASSAGGSGCTGLTTEQMKQQASYEAWDFTNIWRITEGESYPELIMPALTRIIGVAGNLAFGSVTTGSTATAVLTVTNSGNVLLTVTDITYPAGFSGAWSGTIEAGNATTVTVTFAPLAIHSYSGTVTVISDKTGGESTIEASGVGLPVPQPGQICFGATSYTAQEGVKRKVVVKRINGSDGVVSVKYQIKAKTALSGQDYISQSGTLTWTNGQTASKSIKITIPADGKVEGSESFLVLLKSPIGATLTAPSQTKIIIGANTKAAR